MNKLKAYFEANRPRTAREKYLFVQMCIKHVYAPLGVKMTSPDYKWGFLNSLTWSAIVMLYICATYTIVYFWYRDDHMQSLQTLCLLAVLTPSTIKFWTVTKRSSVEAFQALIFFGNHHIYVDGRTPLQQLILDKRANKLLSSCVAVCGTLVVIMTIHSIFPIYMAMFKGDTFYAVPIILPFFNPDSTMGYYISLPYQLYLCSIAALGNLGYEVCSFSVLNNAWAAVDLIECSLRDLPLSGGDVASVGGSCRMEFKAIILQLQDFDRFTRQMKEVFYWRCFIQPPVATVFTALSLFYAYAEDWLSGYGFAAFAYVQMMILCYSGNKIRETHEALLLALWRTKWYALPLAEQKMFILLLQQVQNGPVLTIGPYSVLDFGTAFDITKIIYKVLAMFLRVHE